MNPSFSSRVSFGCALAAALVAARAQAQPPEGFGRPTPTERGPGPFFTGSDSRGYPYYSGYTYFPAYPLYRAYPDYLGYPQYPRDSYNAGYQPSHPRVLELLGWRPPLWRFNDYYSGNDPAYYWSVRDYRSAAPGFAPPPGVLPGPYPVEPSVVGPAPATTAPATSLPSTGRAP